MASVDQLTAADVAAAIAEGALSAVEVATAALDAISARDADLHAYLEVTPHLALEAARRVDERRAAGESLGPLAGVPFAIKDNLQLEGTHTTCGSRMLEGYASQFTATAVSRMLAAGAVPLGKTNMDEFAFGSSCEASAFGPTRNPWDLARVPGGSSGGSAAAVAAGEATLALGSDTGGSIRQPASLCGVVGMKPSYGTVSRYGLVAFGSSLDQVGPLARTVRDAALCLQALAGGGPDPLDATTTGAPRDFLAHLGPAADAPEPLTIGLVPRLLEAEGLDADEKSALSHARHVLADQGATFVELDLPHADAAIAAYYAIASCEAFSNLARFDGVRFGAQVSAPTLAEQTSRTRAAGFGAEARRRQLLGAYLLSSDAYERYFTQAQRIRRAIAADLARALSRCDAILAPASPTCAFGFGERSDPVRMYASDLFTVGCNLAGNPAISVPLGLGAQSGLPVSAQLIGACHDDARLLGVAASLERGHGASASAEPAPVAPAFLGRGGELPA